MANVDEADLVMAAAVAWQSDPQRVLDDCDLPALVAVAGDAASAGSPTAAAATILTGIAGRRPFGGDSRDHASAAWLAAVHVLAQAGLELRGTRSELKEILDRATSAGGDTAAVCDVLSTRLRPRPRPWRRVLRRGLRRALQPRAVTLGHAACPQCGRAVELTPEDANALTWFGTIAGEPFLVARCGCRRGAGRPAATREAAPPAVVAGAVPVVDAPDGPQDAFLALTPAGAVAFVPTPPAAAPDPGAGYDVALVVEPGPADLVGDWRRLLESADQRASVAMDAVHRDQRTGELDVDRLLAEAPHLAPVLTPGRGATVGAGA